MNWTDFTARTETGEPMAFAVDHSFTKLRTRTHHDYDCSIRERDGIDVAFEFVCTFEQAAAISWDTTFSVAGYTGLRAYSRRPEGGGVRFEIGGVT